MPGVELGGFADATIASIHDNGLSPDNDGSSNIQTLAMLWRVFTYDYALATKTMPIEAQVHQAWYLALYQEKLDPKHSTATYEELFPALRTKTRTEQKRALNQTIERTRKDIAIMSDPRTDQRPLMLAWDPPVTAQRVCDR